MSLGASVVSRDLLRRCGALMETKSSSGEEKVESSKRVAFRFRPTFRARIYLYDVSPEGIEQLRDDVICFRSFHCWTAVLQNTSQLFCWTTEKRSLTASLHFYKGVHCLKKSVTAFILKCYL